MGYEICIKHKYMYICETNRLKDWYRKSEYLLKQFISEYFRDRHILRVFCNPVSRATNTRRRQLHCTSNFTSDTTGTQRDLRIITTSSVAVDRVWKCLASGDCPFYLLPAITVKFITVSYHKRRRWKSYIDRNACMRFIPNISGHLTP